MTLALMVCLAAAGRADDKPSVLNLWPDKVPGEKGGIGEEKITGQPGSRNLTNVTKPTLTVYRPAKAGTLASPSSSPPAAPATACTPARDRMRNGPGAARSGCGRRRS